MSDANIPTLSGRRMVVVWVTLPIWTLATLSIASLVPGGSFGKWLTIVVASFAYAAGWRAYGVWRRKRDAIRTNAPE